MVFLNESGTGFQQSPPDWAGFDEYFRKQRGKKKRDYKKGVICWNCGKVINNPKKHYPINSSMFCQKDNYSERKLAKVV